MISTIIDTGPILHLHEIGQLRLLSMFDRLVMPDLVAAELHAHHVDQPRFDEANIQIGVVVVEQAAWKPFEKFIDPSKLQPADAQVFVLAQSGKFQEAVLFAHTSAK